MANNNERVVTIKLNDTQFQKAAENVSRTLEKLKNNLNFGKHDNGFSSVSKSANKAANDVEKASADASKSIKGLSKAANEVDLSSVGSSATKMESQVSSAASNAANSLSKIDDSANKTDLSNVSTAANKMSTQVQKSSADAAESVKSISAAGDKVDLTGVASSASKMETSVTNSSSGASKAILSIQNAINSIDTSNISAQIENISAKIEPLTAMLAGAFAGLGAKAVNYGINAMNNFTQGIKDGFGEYELQMNAVQTIMANTASKGTTINDVNKALDELNRYADETIYNFSQMTYNIGTFTAAGVDLKTSVDAIRGIANLAAVSGSNSQQASTAMYQLSQALATGTVKLMDWNSVVNAGMGGEGFQQALIRTAQVHGAAVDKIVNGQKSFRDSLSDGWLTTEILMETLQQYAGVLDETALREKGYSDDQIKSIIQLGKTAQGAATDVKTFTQLMDTYKEAVGSGWTRIWQLIFGDFEEAKKGFSTLSEQLNQIVDESSKSREAIVQQWADLGGRTELFGFFSNAIKMVQSWIKPIKEGFAEVFKGNNTGKALYNFTKGLNDLVKALTLSEKGARALKTVAKALATVLNALLNVVKLVAGAFGLVFKAIKFVFGIIGTIINAISDLINSIKKLIDASKIIENVGNGFKAAFEGIKTVLVTVTEAIGAFFLGVVNGLRRTDIKAFPTFLEKVGNSFLDFGNKVKTAGHNFQQAFQDKFGTAAQIAERTAAKVRSAIDSIKNAFAWLGEKLIPVGQAFKRFFSDLAGQITLKNFLDLLNGGILTAVLMNLNKLIKGFDGFISLLTGKDGIITNLRDSLKGAGDAFDDFESSFSTLNILAIAASIAALTNSMKELGQLDIASIATATGAMVVMFSSLLGVMTAFAALSKKKKTVKTNGFDFVQDMFDFKSINAMLPSIIGISFSMAALAKAVSALRGMKPEEIATAFAGIAGALVALGGSFRLMGKIDPMTMYMIGDTFKQIGKAFLLMGGALFLLAVALVKVSSVDPDRLADSMSTLTISIIAITTALAALSVISFRGVDSGTFTKIGVSFMAIAGAMFILSMAIGILGKMKPATLAKGLTAVGIAIGLLTVAIATIGKVVPDSGRLVGVASAVMAFAVAINLLVLPIFLLGKMKIRTLVQGLLALAGALGLLAGAIIAIKKFSGNSEDLMASAVAVVGFAAAIAILAIPLRILGTMDLKSMAISLIGLGGALAALVIAMKQMNGFDKQAMLDVSVALLAFAGAFTVFALAMKVMGTISVKSLLTAFVGLSGALLALTYVLRVIVPMLKGSTKTFLEFAKAIALIGVGVLAFSSAMGILAVSATAMQASLTVIIEMIKATLISMIAFIPDLVASILSALIGSLKVLNAALPDILLLLHDIIGKICKFLMEEVGPIAETVFTVIDEVLDKLADHAPAIADSLMRILVAIFQAVANNADALFDASMTIWSSFFEAMGKALTKADPTKLIGMIATMGLMVILFKQMASIKKNVKDALISAAAILGVMTVMGLILAMMSALNVRNAISNAVGLAIAINGFVFAFKALDKVKTKDAVKYVTIGSVMAGVMAAFGLVFAMMTEMGIKSAIPNAAALAIALNGCAVAFNIMDLLRQKDVAKYIAVGTAMAIVMGEMAIVFGIMSGMDVQNAIPNATGLSIALIGISACMTILQLVPIPGALSAIGSLAIGIAGIAAILIAMGALLKIPGVQELINGGIDLLCQLAGGIGKAIGAFISNLIEISFSALNGIADSLNTFMEKLKPFLEQAKSIDASMLTGVSMLAEIILKLTAAGVLDNLFTLPWKESGLEKFANELPQLGKAVVSFADIVRGLDVGSVTAAASAIGILVDLQDKLPAIGGVVQFFTGEKDWEGLSKGLSELGSALNYFAIEVQGTDVSSIMKAIPALSSLAEVQNTLPAINGLMQFFGGQKSWDGLSKGLSELGTAIYDYGTHVKGIDNDAIANSVPALKKLIEIQKSLENSGGLSGFLFGEKDLGHFGENLEDLGTGVANFSKAVSGKGIDVGKTKDMIKCVELVVKMQSNLPVSGGLSGLFGGQDLSGFSSNLKSLGIAIADFGKAVNNDNIDPQRINTAIESAKNIVRLAKTLSGFDKSSLTNFKSALEGAGDIGLKKFNNALGDLHTTVAQKLSTFASKMKEVGPALKGSLGELKGSLKGFDDKVVANANKLGEVLKSLNDIVPELVGGNGIFDKKATDFGEFGKQLKDLTTSISDGMSAYAEFVDSVNLKSITASIEPTKMVINLVSGEAVSFSSFEGFEDACKEIAYGIKAYAKGYDDAPMSMKAILNTIEPSNAVIKVMSKANVTFNEFDGFESACRTVGRGVQAYAKAYNNLDISIKQLVSTVEPTAAIIKMISDASGSSFDKFEGFEDACNVLGNGVQSYSTTISGIDTSAIMSSIRPVTLLIDMISNADGEFKPFTNFDVACDKLSTGLGFYGATFNFISAENINSANIESSKRVLDMVSTYSARKYGKLDNFDVACDRLSTGLSKYAFALSGLTNPEVFATTTVHLGSFFEAMSSGSALTYSGMDGFAEAAQALGTGLKNYATAITDIDPSQFAYAASCIDTLRTSVESFSNGVDYVANITTFVNALAEAGDFGTTALIEKLTGKGEAIKALLDQIVNACNAGGQSIVHAYDALSVNIGKIQLANTVTIEFGKVLTAIQNANKNVSSGILEISATIASWQKSLVASFNGPISTVKAKLNEMLTKIKEYNSKFKIAGGELATSFSNGITDKFKNTDIRKLFVLALNDSVTAVRNYHTQFYQAGAYVVEGFANGISDNSNTAVRAAANMAAQAIAAAKKETGERSPSRVFYQIGDYVVQGFANGINENDSIAVNASTSMAARSIRAFNDTIDSIDVSTIDSTPHITPVIDLSNVRAGAESINSMFGQQKIMAQVNGIQQYTGQVALMHEQQAAMMQYQSDIMQGNQDLMETMNGLRNDIGTYANAIEGQETVMYVDGRKLATTIAKPINQQLGVLSRRGKLG